MIVFFSTIFFPIKFQEAHAISIKDSNIVYNSIDKIIDIDESKVLNITEKITLTYKQSGINVGLARHISRMNNVTRIVDGKSISKTYIHDLKLNSVTMNGETEYSFVERDGDYFVINIGADGDYKSEGQYVYEINYTYDLGEDFISSFVKLSRLTAKAGIEKLSSIASEKRLSIWFCSFSSLNTSRSPIPRRSTRRHSCRSSMWGLEARSIVAGALLVRFPHALEQRRGHCELSLVH